MKKLSWPYIGSTEYEMGSMGPKGDSDRDIAPSYNDGSREKNYGTFNEALHSGGEDTHDYGHEYSAGTFFPLHDMLSDIEEVEYETETKELDAISGEFLSFLKSGSTIIGWGRQSDQALQSVKSLGINVIAVNKEKNESVNISSFASIDANIMFYRARKKCDGFFTSKPFNTSEEAKIAIKNIYSNLSSKSYGMFVSKASVNLEGILKEAGFVVVSKFNNKLKKILVKKSLLKNSALIRHFNQGKKSVSSFICDIAETTQDKFVGLQSYSNLSNNCGLLFKYNSPKNLTFHMGSVKFPIDILFIDDDNKVKKIYSSIQPGSLELFTCANAKNVLEICGGISESLGIEVGDKVFIDFDEASIRKKSNLTRGVGLSSCIIKESKILKSNLEKFERFSILTKNSDDKKFKTNILKAASIESDKKVVIFNLNDFIPNNQIVLYRKTSDLEKTMFCLSLFSEAFMTPGDFIKVSSEKFYEDKFYKNIRKKYLPHLSELIYAMSSKADLLDNLRNHIKREHKPVFVYSGNIDENLIKESVEVALNTSYLNDNKINISDADCFRVPENYSLENIIEATQDRYDCELKFVFKDIVKSAGVPVDNETKAAAKKCIEYLNRARKKAGELSSNFEQNLSIYNRLAEKPNVIKNSAGEYSESSKRNSRICKEVLLNVKESISLLNSIQDISTTEEVIGSLADLSKIFSSSIMSVFDLINFIGTDEFLPKLSEETVRAKGAADDLIITIDRTKSYITKDILGIIILSE